MNALVLECFDGKTAEAEKPSADYLRGYADAQSSLQTKHAEQSAEAIEKIAAILGDLSFGYEEARQAMLNRISPILKQVSDLALPEILKLTFSAHLQEFLAKNLSDALSGPVFLHVNPTDHDVLRSALTLSSPFELQSDASLEQGQAVLIADASTTMFDIVALLDGMQDALSAIEPNPRREDIG
ncbi:FliH/SctL family protein [Pseudooctadecabacter jejudonensis]|uniref:Flagellar assembly protein H n=1 Tax=Pseudooctadecabacter jejudonensis TaxID=1391910 RepID=A0A1Y5S5G8_9RHOB|nr:hypothetical protein [Pseudooctadecabacter jejudonensis]SLN32126.1 hypothetical protein PSJ8397_01501 [Pseudooctadecabacter jejudonensis]